MLSNKDKNIYKKTENTKKIIIFCIVFVAELTLEISGLEPETEICKICVLPIKPYPRFPFIC